MVHDESMSDSTSRRNLAAWLGPLLSVFGLMSYFTLAVQWPSLRDTGWLNLVLVVLGTGLALFGAYRTFRSGRSVLRTSSSTPLYVCFSARRGGTCDACLDVPQMKPIAPATMPNATTAVTPFAPMPNVTDWTAFGSEGRSFGGHRSVRSWRRSLAAFQPVPSGSDQGGASRADPAKLPSSAGALSCGAELR